MCGQESKGVDQMSILLYKLYLIALAGGGFKNVQKLSTWFMDGP